MSRSLLRILKVVDKNWVTVSDGRDLNGCSFKFCCMQQNATWITKGATN